MKRILVPVDGSEASTRAVRYVADLIKGGAQLEIEILNVQVPVTSNNIRRFVSQQLIDTYHRDEGEEALKAAKRLLDESAVAYKATILVGHIAETITSHAAENKVDGIVMGTRGMGPMTNLVLGSVATQVIHAAHVPVTLIK